MNRSKPLLSTAAAARRETISTGFHSYGHGAQLQALRIGDRRKTLDAFYAGKFDPTGRRIPHVAGETGRQLANRLRAEAQSAPAPVAPAKRTRKKAAVTVEA